MNNKKAGDILRAKLAAKLREIDFAAIMRENEMMMNRIKRHQEEDEAEEERKR